MEYKNVYKRDLYTGGEDGEDSGKWVGKGAAKKAFCARVCAVRRDSHWGGNENCWQLLPATSRVAPRGIEPLFKV